MAVYTTIDNPELYFQTKIYTGNGTAIGSGGLALTFDGDTDMSPDMVWIKGRSTTYSHQLYDTVRGVTKRILPDITTAEETDTEALTAFGSDGFTLGSNAGVNTSSGTHVAWSWKAGTSFTNDASATSVGSIDSAGSINTTAGFSIIEWSGSAAAATIAHGLQAVPKMIICKDTNDTYNWGVYHHKNTSAPETDYLYLNENNATADSDSVWNDTAPTSTVFSVKNAGATNASGTDNMIAYCFSDIQGYSKFGSYTGNGNADGTFIYTGFRPAFFMIKKSSATDPWVIFDNKRAPYNYFDKLIYPDSSEAESGASERGDFLSNGVKFKSNHTYFNGSGITYIYMAFAEAPFVNSNGVPCNAR